MRWLTLAVPMGFLGCGPDSGDTHAVGPFPDSHDAMVVSQSASWPVPEGVEYVTGVILGPEDLLVQDVAGRTWRFRLGVGEPDLVPELDSTVLRVSGPPGAPYLEAIRPNTGDLLQAPGPSLADLKENSCPDLVGVRSFLRMSPDMLAAWRGRWEGDDELLFLRELPSGCERKGAVSVPPGFSPFTMASSGKSSILASSMNPRQPLLLVDLLDGGSVVLTTGSASETNSLPAGDDGLDPLWIALPLLRTDRGYLRVLSDVRSAMRVFEMIDSSGQPSRRVGVSGPVGLVSSLPERRILLGMKGTTHPEIVLLRWHWTDGEEGER